VHASFERQGSGPIYAIVDHDSKNGTFVGGARVTRWYLEPGSIVRIGGTLLLFGELDPPPPGFAPDWAFFGQSAPHRRATDALDRVAPTDMSVLILGESGTGKEVAARRIHDQSGRTGEYVAVNCAAIPANLAEATFFGHTRGAFTGATRETIGLFAAAAEGTLFLDEVGELPLELQPKLLRALESREYTPVGASRPVRTSARIVAATNQPLEEMVERHLFRLDLLARLQHFTVELAPLRSRRDDILPLSLRFLEELAPGSRFAMSPDFAEALLIHSWPMNVRELRALMERLALLRDGATRLELRDLPEAMRRPVSHRTAATADAPQAAPPSRKRRIPSPEELRALLLAAEGNVARVAAHYGKDRKQIYRWLERHGIDAESYRPS
jgi:DNA-binding NtrC family response regulator